MTFANQPPARKTLCEYEHTPDGVHRVVLLTTTRAGIDALFDQLTSITNGLLPTAPLMRFLIELPVGIGSFRYGLSKGQAINDAFRNHPPIRTAILLKDQSVAALLDSLVRLLRLENNAVRLFSFEQRNQAAAWLLRDSAG